eukprot:CAMPEP_0183418090 /NCGR_PEP_ID=MMETSP0370-20130417/24870_1 /TAXON_ID=268820 /ORGANISM="Peridinium aciculiferum, Strain PAER-2" /LENGTH=80 /DNA_ID=CAMNT_0025601747 /DNA_START=445 /DNA_END=687 /DNA_ORIENTATION=+
MSEAKSTMKERSDFLLVCEPVESFESMLSLDCFRPNLANLAPMLLWRLVSKRGLSMPSEQTIDKLSLSSSICCKALLSAS